MSEEELTRRFYPESNVAGFSHVDGTVTFYTQIVAAMRPSDVVLDFGAGRGSILADDRVAYRRDLCDLRSRCAHLDGCDIDATVLQNPYLDDAKIISVDRPLPYEDGRFDIIVARYVFEHIENPSFTAQELLRVLKPGGMLAATTPNKWGYIGVNARSVPSRYHTAVLSRSQPQRKPEDVFPTQYHLNTPKALKNAFGSGAEIYITRRSPEPVYHFGKIPLYRTMKWINKHTPDALLPIFDVYIRKY